MEITQQVMGSITVIGVNGEVDGSTAPALQERVLAVVTPGNQVILDMTNVPFMSSAGLRVMLLVYRQLKDNGGKVVLVGLSENIRDTMNATGFLKFFSTAETLDSGLASFSA